MVKDFNTNTYFKIEHRSDYTTISKHLARKITSSGLTKKQYEDIKIVLKELVSNLIKYSTKDPFVICGASNKGIELISVDNGPGISNIPEILQDGISTSGTLGGGMGAMKRLSDEFEIFSDKTGTVIVCTFSSKEKNSLKRTFKTLHFALPGEHYCGDIYDVKNVLGHTLYFVFDGLGHGEKANISAAAALEAFQNLNTTDPVEGLQLIHEAITHTRGGVGMLISYNKEKRTLDYCGVGNIAARLVGFTKTKHLMSFDGILGHLKRGLVLNSVEIDMPYHLVIHSDGIKSRWNINKKNLSILKESPQTIASYLFKNYYRKNDDTIILVDRI